MWLVCIALHCIELHCTAFPPLVSLPRLVENRGKAVRCHSAPSPRPLPDCCAAATTQAHPHAFPMNLQLRGSRELPIRLLLPRAWPQPQDGRDVDGRRWCRGGRCLRLFRQGRSLLYRLPRRDEVSLVCKMVLEPYLGRHECSSGTNSKTHHQVTTAVAFASGDGSLRLTAMSAYRKATDLPRPSLNSRQPHAQGGRRSDQEGVRRANQASNTESRRPGT